MKEEEEKEITLQDQGSEPVELEPLQVTVWFNENSYLSSVEVLNHVDHVVPPPNQLNLTNQPHFKAAVIK